MTRDVSAVAAIRVKPHRAGRPQRRGCTVPDARCG